MLAHFPRAWFDPSLRSGDALQQDPRRGLVVAAAADHLDRPMQICLAVRQLLGELERKAGLHQHVEPPALDFRSLVLWCLGYLGHWLNLLRLFLDEPCPPKFVLDYVPRNAPSRLDSAAATAVSRRRVKSRTRASSTSRSASASAPIARICDRSSA